MKLIAKIKRELIFQGTNILYRDEWPNGQVTWIKEKNISDWLEVNRIDKEILELARSNIEEKGEK